MKKKNITKTKLEKKTKKTKTKNHVYYTEQKYIYEEKNHVDVKTFLFFGQEDVKT